MRTFVKRLIYLFTGILILSLAACASSNNQTSFTDDPRNSSKNNLVHSAWKLKTNIFPNAATKVGKGIKNMSSFPKSIRAIDYGNCTHLYAVQPGDTLDEIAKVSATTTDFVLSRNDLDSADDLYPGLVLCLETGGSGLIPPTGGTRSGVEVTDVSADQNVTVRGMNFPAGESVNVYIFQRGVGNPNIAQLGSITIPTSGTFERSFQIPTALRSYRNLIIRFRNPDENVSASATFINADVDRITPDECAEYYTVRSGDVLGLIAQDVNVPVDRLIQINNLIDANLVLPGQMLCIQVK